MTGNAPAILGMAAARALDTVSSMSQPNAIPAPPSEPAWDIIVTRLTHAARPQVEACALGLARQFHALGLGSDTQTRQTPRGLSTFLAIVGQRGLICIVDLTLVDGMAIGQGPRAALDIRLLDACGDVVADGLASAWQGCASDDDSAAKVFISENLDRAATAVFVATLAAFDLLRPASRCG
ncbi:MAG: hypothetical protein H7346_05635 [Burkholderiaceae bacterium]|nr:hypothetical protein [Burkholderiaceae bacterium]